MTNHDAERKRIESLIYSFAASAPEPVNLASEAARKMLADHIYGNWAQVQMERERRLVASHQAMLEALVLIWEEIALPFDTMLPDIEAVIAAAETLAEKGETP